MLMPAACGVAVEEAVFGVIAALAHVDGLGFLATHFRAAHVRERLLGRAPEEELFQDLVRLGAVVRALPKGEAPSLTLQCEKGVTDISHLVVIARAIGDELESVARGQRVPVAVELEAGRRPVELVRRRHQLDK